MRAFIIVAAFFITLNALMSVINYIGDNYSDIFGPAILLGLVAVLIARTIKKGN